MNNRCTDPTAWRQLSPLLDELLELGPADRAVRLAALREGDPALADDLVALLDSLPPLEAAGFLAMPALPPPAGLAGQTVGPYLLQREIGQGGMGSVWLAQRADGRYEGRVAIKFMRAGLVAPGAAERFLREGQLLARLDHPHIAKLLDAGVRPADSAAGGQPYLVLEYVAGEPIDRHCDAQGLDTEARVRLVLAVLGAVAHAHSRLILHRDLKPSNILVTADGQPKLLDFGVGKLLADAEAGPAAAPHSAAAEVTQFTQLAYTARYAAPEQVQQQDLTTATDVYALGVLLYGLLGGGHPTEREGATPLAQMQAVVDSVPARLSDAVRRRGGAAAARQARALRGDMDTILARTLKKDPAERYANAAALADDLRRWLDHEPVQARRDTAGYRISRFLRRHAQAVVAAGAAATLALAGGATVALWQAHQARQQRSQAEALVEFMIGDLQKKLDQLGRTDLMQSVGERALAYFSAEAPASMDSEALARHARALRLIGESARQRMDMTQAKRALAQAAETTARLLERSPRDIGRLREHASSLERLVALHDSTGEEVTALGLTRQISDLRWRAAAEAPQDLALRLHALEGNQWLAFGLIGQSPSSEEALALLGKTGGALEALPADLAGLARVRAMNHGLTGQALAFAGRYVEAEAAFRVFFVQAEPQPRAATSLLARSEDRVLRLELTRVLLNQGRLAPAIEQAAAVVSSAARDLEESQDNLLVAGQLIQGHTVLAELLWLNGQRRDALAQWQAIDGGLARVGEVSTENAFWHLNTMGSVLKLRVRMQPRPLRADAPLMAALQAHEALVTRADQQGLRQRSRMLLSTLAIGLAHGDALLAQGQPEQARLRWQAVAARALPAAQVGEHAAMQHLALAWLRLGQPEQARPWVERLRASPWRHPDLDELQQRLARAGDRPPPAR